MGTSNSQKVNRALISTNDLKSYKRILEVTKGHLEDTNRQTPLRLQAEQNIRRSYLNYFLLLEKGS
jgi:hypothetical protein